MASKFDIDFTKAGFYTAGKYLKYIGQHLTGEGAGAVQINGSESFDGSVSQTSPLKPQDNGNVQADSCEMIIRNTGKEKIWINTNSNGAAEGLPVNAGDTYNTVHRFKSDDDLHYVYFPNSAGTVTITYIS